MHTYRDPNTPAAGASLLARARDRRVLPVLVLTIAATLPLPWIAVEVDVAGNMERFSAFARLRHAPLHGVLAGVALALLGDFIGRAARNRFFAALGYVGSGLAMFGAFAVLDFAIMFTLFAPNVRLFGGVIALVAMMLAVIRSAALAGAELARGRL